MKDLLDAAIIASIALLITMLTVPPNLVWEEEKRNRELRREKMEILNDAQNFYYNLLGEYTLDHDELFYVIESILDSTMSNPNYFLGDDQVLNKYTLDMKDGWKSNEKIPPIQVGDVILIESQNFIFDDSNQIWFSDLVDGQYNEGEVYVDSKNGIFDDSNDCICIDSKYPPTGCLECYVDEKNGEYDRGESFVDVKNGKYDNGEKFTDGNGKYDSGEEFTDGNGVWDEGEVFIDLNGKYDEGEFFIDSYNGKYDEGENFIDNKNGVYDEGESFTDVGNGKYDKGYDMFIDLKNDKYDESEVFIDSMNGKYDDKNGKFDKGEKTLGDFSESEQCLCILNEEKYSIPDSCKGCYIDQAEAFTDIGNRAWDEGEQYVDENENKKYDYGEKFTDIGNGIWDMKEPFVDAKNGRYDDGDKFVYMSAYNSKVWVAKEFFYDGDLEYTSGDNCICELDIYNKYQIPDGCLECYIDGNGTWDDAEPIIQEKNTEKLCIVDPAKKETLKYQWDNNNEFCYSDVDQNGMWNKAEIYKDGNGQWDDKNGVYDLGEEFTDKNKNGKWDANEKFIDQAEVFEDTKNGKWDLGEVFIDNRNGYYDDGEHFVDGKNQVYDEGENFIDKKNGKYDEGELFVDGNGKWDNGESYIDGNGKYDQGEIFVDAVNGKYDEGEKFEDIKNGQFDPYTNEIKGVPFIDNTPPIMSSRLMSSRCRLPLMKVISINGNVITLHSYGKKKIDTNRDNEYDFNKKSGKIIYFPEKKSDRLTQKRERVDLQYYTIGANDYKLDGLKRKRYVVNIGLGQGYSIDTTFSYAVELDEERTRELFKIEVPNDQNKERRDDLWVSRDDIKNYKSFNLLENDISTSTNVVKDYLRKKYHLSNNFAYCPISDKNKDKKFIFEIEYEQGSNRQKLIIKAPIDNEDKVSLRYGIFRYRPGLPEEIVDGVANW